MNETDAIKSIQYDPDEFEKVVKRAVRSELERKDEVDFQKEIADRNLEVELNKATAVWILFTIGPVSIVIILGWGLGKLLGWW